MIRKKDHSRKPEIDLSGPEGNSLVLLRYADRLAKDFELDGTAIQAEMMAGDYEHLIAVFDKHFGAYVDLVR